MADERSSRLFKRISHAGSFFTIKFFVFCQGFLQFSQLMTSSLVKSSISTIEKRFGLSSQMAGTVVSFNEVGNTLLIIFVSYMGCRVHRPRFIGYGAVLVSMAGLVMSLPHFISGPYEYDRSVTGSESTTSDICLPNRNETEVCTKSEKKETQVVVMLLLLGQTLLGIGGVPIQPFGISYIDDFASKSNSPLYIGILFAATTVGPALAFIVGAATLRYFVDIDKIPAADIHINSKDPRWVGAWWLGFIISASVVAIASIPYFFFPKELPREEESPQNSPSEAQNNDFLPGRSKEKELKDYTLKQFIGMFPVVFMRLMKNPILVVVILAMVNLSGMIAGIATFMAKLLERQFSLSASVANMILGAVNIPSGMFGIALGGAIIRNCRLSLTQIALMSVISMGLCTICDVPLFFLGCQTQTVAGLDLSGSSGIEEHVFDCNQMCKCSPSAYNPVCGANGIEYISPCYAGCTGLNIESETHKVLNYTSCNCIVVDGGYGYATPGSCSFHCSKFLMPFVTIASLSTFLGSLAHTPGFVLVLRNVDPEDKSFAIGIQFLMQRVLAWLPAPVVYGSLIDTACVLWQYKCQKRTACRYYNNVLFRHRFVGLQIFLEASCFALLCILYFMLKKKESGARRESGTSSPSVVQESAA
ncbi:solute carrier organic anion transporter family member 2B1 isoform X1 [Podarcis lilfordi]|uniref:Solute carrier organic anion transporter family member n=1 Tax=Podarcis lilfordi TaxID=74358 RepID=A0AA35KAK1_9SAUR|nr:solute carrier organic anion transporter family member 2B1 isoform X1 [Podarcis lilfordi]